MFLESCKEPYRQIDKVHRELLDFEDIVANLKRSCGLFDIQPPDEKFLKQCRRELKLIKVIFYFNYLFRSMGQKCKLTNFVSIEKQIIRLGFF